MRPAALVRAFALFATLAAASCSQPCDQEQFIRADRAVDGVYTFELEFPDTLAVYDVYLYSASARKDAVLENVGLKLMWLSPDGDAFRENVYFRNIAPDGSMELYRSVFSVSKEGLWRFSVSPAAEMREQISGIGVICRKNGSR